MVVTVRMMSYFVGHFGSGILSYFLFLKWLMQLNLFISILLMIFIVIPQGILGTSDQVPPAPCNNSKQSTL